MYKQRQRLSHISKLNLHTNTSCRSTFYATGAHSTLFYSSKALSSNKEQIAEIPMLEGFPYVGRFPYLLKENGMKKHVETVGGLALQNEEHGMCKFHMLNPDFSRTLTYVVTKPLDVMKILWENYDCISRSKSMKMVENFCGSALLTDEESLAREKRGKAYKQVYHDKTSINLFEPIVKRIIEKSLDKFKNKASGIDAAQFFDDLGIRIILESFLPDGFSEEEIKILRDEFVFFIRKEVLNTSKLFASNIPLIGKWLTQPQKTKKQLTSILLKVLNSKKDRIESSNNFINLILKIRGNSNEPLSSNPDITGDATMAILAGVGTTATALTIIVKMLSAHPEIKTRLRSEIQNNLQGKPIDYHSISKISYLQQVINEALRLCPVSPLLLRHAEKGFEFDGKKFNKGDSFMFVPYMTNRSKIYWGDTALQFDPERFDPENIKKMLAGFDFQEGKQYFTGLFYPFGIGHRDCIGQRTAEMILKLWLATAYTQYDIHIKQNDFECTFDPGTTHFIKPTLLEFAPLVNNSEATLIESQQPLGPTYRC